MTYTGAFTSIERHGIAKREESNVLLRAAGWSPVQILGEGAVRNMTCPVTGLSGNLMLGQTPAMGTNYTDVIVNRAFIAEQTKSVERVIDAL
jgi:hypothetical protein